MPNLGQKKRVKKSNPDPSGACPVTIIPLPAHFSISWKLGCNSATSLPDESSTWKYKNKNNNEKKERKKDWRETKKVTEKTRILQWSPLIWLFWEHQQQAHHSESKELMEVHLHHIWQLGLLGSPVQWRTSPSHLLTGLFSWQLKSQILWQTLQFHVLREQTWTGNGQQLV